MMFDYFVPSPKQKLFFAGELQQYALIEMSGNWQLQRTEKFNDGCVPDFPGIWLLIARNDLSFDESGHVLDGLSLHYVSGFQENSLAPKKIHKTNRKN